MADDHVLTAGPGQHAWGNFAGEGAFLLPVDVLRADFDQAAASLLEHRGDIDERRANHDFVAIVLLDQRQEGVEESARFLNRFVHLPIGGDDLLSFHCLIPLTSVMCSRCQFAWRR